jgi:hypothetical protein
MSLALATAWHPRGEGKRFQKLLPNLLEVYDWIGVSLPPDVDEQIVEQLTSLTAVGFRITGHWSEGRHTALQSAAGAPVDAIHYVDFDRLLRWVETRPSEWAASARAVPGKDCLIHGRTPPAYATHPKALVQTEAISNRVVSFLLGKEIDASAGSKGFSRDAARYLLKHSRPGRALGMDGEWPVLLYRAGFQIDYMEVDGLDWETADRYQDAPAGLDRQSRTAEEYDRDASNWLHRVAVADEIVAAGLEAFFTKDMFNDME